MKQMAVHILCIPILIRHRIAFAAETVHFQMRVYADRFTDSILAQPSVMPQTVTVMRIRMRVLHQRRQLDIGAMPRIHRRVTRVLSLTRQRRFLRYMRYRGSVALRRYRLSRLRARNRRRGFRVMAMAVRIRGMAAAMCVSVVTVASSVAVMAFAQFRQRRLIITATALKIRVLQRLRGRRTLFGIVIQHFLQ